MFRGTERRGAAGCERRLGSRLPAPALVSANLIHASLPASSTSGCSAPLGIEASEPDACSTRARVPRRGLADARQPKQRRERRRRTAWAAAQVSRRWCCVRNVA